MRQDRVDVETHRPRLGDLLAARLASDGDYWTPLTDEQRAERHATWKREREEYLARVAAPRSPRSRRKPKP